MAELEILTCPDPILLSEAETVARVSWRIRRLAHDMLETMYAASGIGLAAPQVGVQKRVIVVDVGEAPLVLVNPKIAAAEGEQVGLDGILFVGRIEDLTRLWRVSELSTAAEKEVAHI